MLVEQKTVEGIVSVVSFNDTFYVLRKQIGAARAIEAIGTIRKIFHCASVDEEIVDRASEDALQVSAAIRIIANYVVTRNVSHFVPMFDASVTPQEFLAIAEAKKA